MTLFTPFHLAEELLHDPLLPRWLEQTSSTLQEDEDDDEDDDGIHIVAAILSNFFLFTLIFGLSATVDVKNLLSQLHNKWAIATGVAMQFLIMPLLGFLSVMSLRNHGLTHSMAVALLVVTSSPGGSYSNWWCSTFNAELALSVAMTAVSTILSVGMLPANLLLYSYLAFGVTGQDGDGVLEALDFKALFLSLGIVILAILTGLLSSYKMHSRNFQLWSNRVGSISGIILILVSAFLASGTGDAETNFWSQPWQFYVGVSIPCLVGIVLANLLSRMFRLSKPECVAVSIECCYQNVGIATSVAVNMFTDPTDRAEALAVPLFYGILEAIVIGIYCVWAWKVQWTKAPKDEKLCVVVTHTYELDRHAGSTHEEIHPEEGSEEVFDEQEERQEEARATPGAIEQEAPIPRGLSRWYRALFEPRYPEGYSITRTEQAPVGPDADDAMPAGSDIETPVKSKNDGGERNRFVSEDYTAATTDTSDSSPPNTPGGPFSSFVLEEDDHEEYSS